MIFYNFKHVRSIIRIRKVERKKKKKKKKRFCLTRINKEKENYTDKQIYTS